MNFIGSIFSGDNIRYINELRGSPLSPFFYNKALILVTEFFKSPILVIVATAFLIWLANRIRPKLMQPPQVAKNFFVLGVIAVFVFALFLRFWKISDYPVSLSMDEVAIGYNAYSILKTGKDEYGSRLPLTFRSIGDYKTPVVVYLISGSMSIFGENEFAVRFPSALLGAATAVVFVFLLRHFDISKHSSILGGLWLAISPWHIFLSRTSFDGIVALFFLVLGVLVFLKSVRVKSTILLSTSCILLAMSAWSYHAERVFVPILTIFLLIYFKPKKLLLPAIVTSLFVLPFLYSVISGSGILSRAGLLCVGRVGGIWLTQYLNYFNPYLWFAKGLNFTPPGYFDVGLMYIIDFPVFVLGGYYLFKSKNSLVRAIALFWFLAGPIPGSLTHGGINPGRTIIWLPFFGIVMASGFEFILARLRFSKIVLVLYLAFSIWNLAFFVDMFTNNFPKYYADLWHWGYKEVSEYACANHDKYQKIIITDKYGIEIPQIKTIPYLYILFYCKWDPATYLANRELFNIEMRQPQWRIDSKEKNWLLIGSRWDFPEDLDKKKIMKTIYFPASAYEPKPAFYMVETTLQ